MKENESIKPEKKARYRKIEVRMWGDEKFRNLTPIPPCGQGLWVFLLTGPHTGPIPGLFRSGRAAMAEELDWPVEAFDEAFREASSQGMVKADWKAKVVWVPNAVACNKPESPNVVTSWGAEWDLIPECDLKREAYDSLRSNICALGEGFAKAFDKAFAKPSGKAIAKAYPKTCANQEQEQEQEQKQEKTPLSLSPPPAPIDDRDPIVEIFGYWQTRMESPRSKLDSKRRGFIERALKLGYSPKDLCKAIRGCSLTPHNMGTNDRQTKFNGIGLIFRDAEHIERFIGNDNAPPRQEAPTRRSAQPSQSQLDDTNARAKALLFGKEAALGRA